MSVALTRLRFTNALRCYASYALSRFGSVRFVHHAPLFVSVEPAAICQLRCPECPVGKHQQSKNNNSRSALISRESWQRTLFEVSKTAFVVQFYFQGEPLLNKDLPQMIREAHDVGLYSIVSTNAQALTPQMATALVVSGLDRIIISMDGLTEASYNAYRVGGSLEQTKAALRYLREAKGRKPIIELQVLRLKTNEREWADFKRQYKQLGADCLTFKTAQLYNYSDGHPLMPTNARYSRYIQSEDGHYHRRPLRCGCFRVWSGCVITTDGEVLPCCYDKAHEYAYGNIMESSLKELFTGTKAQQFRLAALDERPHICQECWR